MFLEYAGYSHMFSNSICEMCGQASGGCQTASLSRPASVMGADKLLEQENQPQPLPTLWHGIPDQVIS